MSGDGSQINGLRAWRVEPTGRREEISIGADGADRGSGGILWIDLCGVVDRDAAVKAIEALAPAGFSQGAFGHLFETVSPEVYSDSPRFLNAFWAKARIDAGVHGVPIMLFAKVTFLVGGDWLITNRSRGFGATSGVTYAGDPVSLDELCQEVDRRWTLDVSSAGDLAILMLRGLCASFRPALAQVERRLQNAELSFARHTTGGGAGDLDAGAYREQLLALKWVVEGAARDIASLNRRASSPEGAWFQLTPGTAPAVAVETQELVEEAMATCSRQGESVRAGLELIAATVGAEQLQLAREDRDRTAGFERRVGQLAAVLGGPALVVGFFDAMPEVMAGCPLSRGIVMAALMVLAAFVLWQVLDRRLSDHG